MTTILFLVAKRWIEGDSVAAEEASEEKSMSSPQLTGLTSGETELLAAAVFTLMAEFTRMRFQGLSKDIVRLQLQEFRYETATLL